ncbi:TIR domain-containing protein [Pseudomonadota bacterium]
MSYCHADEAWAGWLHKSLESYRVPGRLAGQAGLHGPVPEKLSPIFRDRDELSSSSDLSAKIKEAIADSESLLVVCSPAAARSMWVNEEIRHYRSLGKRRIYCVIVEGDPQSADPQHACFPAALLEGETHQHKEPMAADVRKWADGKALAKLKLAAGLLGVRLDELRQREQQRKRKLQALAGIGIVATLALLWFTFDSRLAERDARLAQEAQQALAENMLAQFLEQAERLGDVADLETRKAFADALSSYLADLDPADLTPESRRQLGVALANRGVILRDEGQLEQSMEVFGRAQQVLQLLVDESDDEEALFELSQVEYWIGQVHLDRGRMAEAGVSFKAYSDVSNTLHEKQPDNADWTMEAAYAQSNLGNLESRRIPSDPQLVLEYFKSALELNELAARQDPKYERELAESHAYLADAWLGVCDLGQVMDQRLKNVELAARYFGLNPASNILKQDYAHALSGLSTVQQKSGFVTQAMDSLTQSLKLQAELVDEDPSNQNRRWNLTAKSIYLAQLIEFSGNEEKSWAMTVSIESDLQNLVEQSPDIQIDNAIAYGRFLRDYANRAYRKGETVFANRMLAESIDRLRGIADQHPDHKRVQFELTMSYFYYWEHHHGAFPDSSVEEWLVRLEDTLNLTGCSDLNIASRQAVMMETPGQAQTFVSRLINQGYKEPEFMQFCASYRLCTSQAE